MSDSLPEDPIDLLSSDDPLDEPDFLDPVEEAEARHRRFEAVKDNIEAFTVALIMALVIKHFCVEAFKIPTGSMMPTLRGSKNVPNGQGDRILVDKWAYVGSGPERWDVAVFRYPLNQAKHFIKRVAGVGPEWIRIVHGDLWTRPDEDAPWRIATKRRRARDSLYQPVYPPLEPPQDTYYRDRLPTAPDYWEADEGWAVIDYQTLSFKGAGGGTIRFQKRIGRHSSPDDYDMETSRSDLVRDARFVLSLESSGSADAVLRWRTAEDAAVELRLTPPSAPEPSRISVRHGEVEIVQDLERRLVPGVSLGVELEVVDGRVYVHFDGAEVVHIDERREVGDRRDFDDFTQRFEIETAGGTLDVTGLRIDRDLHYVTKGMSGLGPNDDGVWVPDGHYFMLGDNTESSSDSRQWELTGVILDDGSEIWYEAGSSDNRPRLLSDGSYRVIDREGVERRWRSEDVAERDSRDAPFVDRDLIVGRAFYIFWPVLPSFPGRVRFIH